MKVYKITDEAHSNNVAIAYLHYYEKSKTFAIEISPEISARELPIFFSGFAQKGLLSVDIEWSRRWVMERIVPEDRQNLGSILKENKIDGYDPMKLLMKGCGRCSQDECAVSEADILDLPIWLAERAERKLKLVAALSGLRVLLVFGDGTVRIADMSERVREDKSFKVLENNRSLFESVTLQPGGNGICWNDWLFIPATALYSEGNILDISADEIKSIVEIEVMDTAEVCEELGCTRQYADKLVRDGRLEPIRNKGNTRLYHKSDVERLKW